MKHYLVTASEMQKIDQETIETFGLPGIVLMENAGRSAVQYFLSQYSHIVQKRIGILAGSGNNGGDGFVMARYLNDTNADLIVYLFTNHEKLKGDARFNFNLMKQLNVPVVEIPDESALNAAISSLETRNIFIDALLGTGLRSEVRGRFKKIIEWVNGSLHPVFAVDIPSGLHADKGRVCGTCIRADATITFGHQKIGHVIGEKYCGRFQLSDIGIPTHITKSVSPSHYLLTPKNLSLDFYNRPSDAHKGTTGHILVIGGSAGKTGACAMTSQAAMRIGCGRVTLGIGRSLNAILENLLLEVMTLPLTEEYNNNVLGPFAYEQILKASKDKTCIAIGPGMGAEYNTKSLIQKMVQEIPIPMVMDADALNCLAGNTEVFHKAKATHILTPHPGEMARLTGLSTREILSDRLTFARFFAQSHKVILILKGDKTIIAFPDGRIALNATGNPGMATGGMGDVLTGIIAGIIAQGLSPEKAVETGVFIHGYAADRLARQMGQIGFVASDVINALPSTLKFFSQTLMTASSQGEGIESAPNSPGAPVLNLLNH